MLPHWRHICQSCKATNWNPLDPGDQPTDPRAFFASLSKTDGPHGGVIDYKSPCTDLLGWVIERAAGQRHCDLFSQYIWACNGAGIIPETWIDDTETNGDPDAWDKGNFASHFPGVPMHYRSKWYVIPGDSPILFGFGIHGQYLFVDRKSKLVMAKQSGRGCLVNCGIRGKMINAKQDEK